MPLSGRHVPPEPPQIRLRSLLLGRRGDGDDDVLARIERTRDPPDGAALAGGIRAFEREHQRAIAKALVPREHGQFRLVLGERALIRFLVEPLRSRSRLRISATLPITDGAGATTGGGGGLVPALTCRIAVSRILPIVSIR